MPTYFAQVTSLSIEGCSMCLLAVSWDFIFGMGSGLQTDDLSFLHLCSSCYALSLASYWMHSFAKSIVSSGWVSTQNLFKDKHLADLLQRFLTLFALVSPNNWGRLQRAASRLIKGFGFWSRNQRKDFVEFSVSGWQFFCVYLIPNQTIPTFETGLMIYRMFSRLVGRILVREALNVG